MGCGTSDRDQVRNKIDELAEAAAGRRYGELCQQVLSPSLAARFPAAGITCEQGMRIAFGDVVDPALSIGRITVHGRTAVVIVLSSARNQTASLDAIDLVKTNAGWRVSSLASSVGAAAG